MTARVGEVAVDPAAKPARARLLLVDDDTRILSGLRRQLHRRYEGQLRDARMVDDLARALILSGLEPDRVALEIESARALQMRTVAEGVETPEGQRASRLIGFDWAQGYLYGRPVDPDKLLGGIVSDAP